jgi:hypothetical protein
MVIIVIAEKPSKNWCKHLTNWKKLKTLKKMLKTKKFDGKLNVEWKCGAMNIVDKYKGLWQ